MADLNYATSYSQALANAYPFALYFGELYATPNNNRYRWVNAKSIEIPRLSTTGRINANRDSIGEFHRNYDNDWEQKVLTFHREWDTLVHPMDIDETNLVASIGNITETFNNEQKFPEMDAYTVSKIYTDWITTTDEEGNLRTADTTELSASNILSVFDNMMLKMDNERVPAAGRILYLTHEAKTLMKAATEIKRNWDVQSNADAINRIVSRLDEVTLKGVPKSLMQTKFNFTTGYSKHSSAKAINMFLVHPDAVITPEKYTFAQLDPPSAGTKGKYSYYEESYGDVFILNKKSGAIQFNVTNAPVQSA